MNSIINEIFDSVVVNGKFDDMADKVIQKEITCLLKPYEKTLGKIEYEELRDLLYSISLTAKKEGFSIGFNLVLAMMKNL